MPTWTQEVKRGGPATVSSYKLSRLDNNNKRYVSNETSAKNIINKLDSIKNVNSSSNTLFLEQKFSNLKIGKNENINEVILRFDDVVNEFITNDEPLDERKIKINFPQAIRLMYNEALSKTDKNELNNLTMNDLKLF